MCDDAICPFVADSSNSIGSFNVACIGCGCSIYKLETRLFPHSNRMITRCSLASVAEYITGIGLQDDSHQGRRRKVEKKKERKKKKNTRQIANEVLPHISRFLMFYSIACCFVSHVQDHVVCPSQAYVRRAQHDMLVSPYIYDSSPRYYVGPV